MKTLQNISTTMLLVISMSMSQLHAEETQQRTEQLTPTSQTLALDEKIATIESQIDALKSKGLRNLSKEERIEFGSLKKQLLIAQRGKTAQQDKIIEIEKAETQALLDRQNEMLDSLKRDLQEIKIEYSKEEE